MRVMIIACYVFAVLSIIFQGYDEAFLPSFISFCFSCGVVFIAIVSKAISILRTHRIKEKYIKIHLPPKVPVIVYENIQ